MLTTYHVLNEHSLCYAMGEPLLASYVVTYHEEEDVWGDGELEFHCMAEDAEHAAEQCLNAYPDCIILATNEIAPAPRALAILASKPQLGGHDWINGPVSVGPADMLRPATLDDFDFFRVDPTGHIA